MLGRDAEAAKLASAVERIGRRLKILMELYGTAQVLDELDRLRERVGPKAWAEHQAAAATPHRRRTVIAL